MTVCSSLPRPWVRSSAAVAALSVAFVAASCAQTDPELRVWLPEDHHNNAAPASSRSGQSTGEADPNRPEGLDDVTLAAWKQHCLVCHGQLGKGDGPQGAILKARDLSTPEYQASQTDEAMALTIRRGKEKMPSFAALPESTIANLVKLIRVFGRLAETRKEPGAQAAHPPVARPASPAAHPTPESSASARAPGGNP